MSRRLVNLTLENVSDLPSRCRSCVFWELDQVAAQRACEQGDPAWEKEAWLSDTLLEWGNCGWLAYVDNEPAGYALFAPPAYVPRSLSFPTSPVSADAVLLMTARVPDKYAGGGIGRMLVQAVAGDAAKRGTKAIEAFGYSSDGDHQCLAPTEYLEAVGFTVVRDHAHTPRLRLDVKTALSWREEVEYAIDKLLGNSPVLAPR